MNGLTLAYIGDAYYELCIRMHLTLNHKLTRVDDLHKKAITYTSAVAQGQVIEQLINAGLIEPHEIEIYKRGRNVSGPGRRNVDAKTYHMATGFECLIGELYLNGKKRCDEIIHLAINYIEKGDFHGESREKNSD